MCSNLNPWYISKNATKWKKWSFITKYLNMRHLCVLWIHFYCQIMSLMFFRIVTINTLKLFWLLKNYKHPCWWIIFRNDRRVYRFILCQNYMMFPLVCPPSSFEAVYCFICGRRRVAAVSRHRRICLVLSWKHYSNTACNISDESLSNFVVTFLMTFELWIVRNHIINMF